MGVKKIRGVKKMSPHPPMVSIATWSADHDFLCVRPKQSGIGLVIAFASNAHIASFPFPQIGEFS